MNQTEEPIKITFQLYSDIHIELQSNSYPIIKPLAPYLFLAGDIAQIDKPNFKPFFDYLAKNWLRVFYVLGNHEFYHKNKTHNQLRKQYHEFFQEYSNVHLLDNSSYDLVESNIDLRIFGTTLWSKLDPEFGKTSDTNGFGDINCLFIDDNVPMNVEYFNNLNNECLNKLLNEIKQCKELGKNLIVMSHFPPLRKTNEQPNATSHSIYSNETPIRKQYFANDLTNKLLKTYQTTESDFYSNIKLFMSGHTHYSYDFNYCGTRFIANQVGYKTENTTGVNYDGLFSQNI